MGLLTEVVSDLLVELYVLGIAGLSSAENHHIFHAKLLEQSGRVNVSLPGAFLQPK